MNHSRGEGPWPTADPWWPASRTRTPAERAAEEKFVFGGRPPAAEPPPAHVPTAQKAARQDQPRPLHHPHPRRPRPGRQDAALERQLQGIEPNQVQEILESAWSPGSAPTATWREAVPL